MRNARGFYSMAVRESNCPDRACGVTDLAEIAMMGAIGQFSNSRDEFIKEGFAYLDRFEDQAAETKKSLLTSATDDHDTAKLDEAKEIVQIIDQWKIDVKNISMAEYFQLLADDWDEGHEAANG